MLLTDCEYILNVTEVCTVALDHLQVANMKHIIDFLVLSKHFNFITA
jgi:hypothetical protein